MLRFANSKLDKLPDVEQSKSNAAHTFDVTGNVLSSGLELSPFGNLFVLVIDNNRFSTLREFPILSNLQRFSANNNQFSDIRSFIEESRDRFGNLTNISTLNNPINTVKTNPTFYRQFCEQLAIIFPQLIEIDGVSRAQPPPPSQPHQELTFIMTYDQKAATAKHINITAKSEGNRRIQNDEL